MAAATLLQTSVSPFSSLIDTNRNAHIRQTLVSPSSSSSSSLYFSRWCSSKVSLCAKRRKQSHLVFSCLPPLPSSSSSSSSSRTARDASTKLYVSGLSFRTTEKSLTNAFKNFGQLIGVNLVIDKIANRPRGFAFLRYATVEESKKAIDGMHGKFLDGRVIFVEVAKSKWELPNGIKQEPRRY